MTYFRKIFARTAISYIHFIEIGESTLNCVSIWERSHMTSARFWKILPSPLSALGDPPPFDDVSICQTPPPYFKEPPKQFTNSNTKCLSYPA